MDGGWWCEPGRFNAKSLAEFEGSLVEWTLADQTPQVELIALGPATETPEHVSVEVDGETCAVERSSCNVNGAGTSKGWAATFCAVEWNEAENLFDGDLAAQSLIVEAWHGTAEWGYLHLAAGLASIRRARWPR